jgi:hypothetical protein
MGPGCHRSGASSVFVAGFAFAAAIVTTCTLVHHLCRALVPQRTFCAISMHKTAVAVCRALIFLRGRLDDHMPELASQWRPMSRVGPKGGIGRRRRLSCRSRRPTTESQDKSHRHSTRACGAFSRQCIISAKYPSLLPVLCPPPHPHLPRRYRRCVARREKRAPLAS